MSDPNGDCVFWAAYQSITIDIPCENSESGCHVWPTFRLSIIWAPWANQSVTVGNLYENPTSGCHVWPTGPKARELKPGGFFLAKPSDLYALIWWQAILVVIKWGKLLLFQTGCKTPITYLPSFQCWNQTCITVPSASQHSTTRRSDWKLVGL